MSMTVRFYLLVLLLAFYSVNAIAAECWPELTGPNPKKETFILAMGANTGKLKMANHDAQSFAEGIQARFRVPYSHVCVLTNVKFFSVRRALKKLLKWVREEDRVFIYYSGHGTTAKDRSGDETDCLDEGFVTYYRPGEKPKHLVDDYFVKLVNKINTQHITTFIDTCFASGIQRGEKGCPNGTKSKFLVPKWDDELLPSKNCPPSQLFKELKGTLFAAAEERKNAWEYPDKGGIFTYTFLHIMKNHPKNANAKQDDIMDEIFKLTAERVKKETENTPCQQHPQRWPKP
jgi:hypothetical protein